MTFSLSTLFPKIEDTGLNDIGFLFGAGTSKDAGYKLMDDLTKSVVSNLSSKNKAVFEEVLRNKKLTYDPVGGTPNIEEFFSFASELFVTTEMGKYKNLETEIRNLIVKDILSVTNPELKYHIRFLKALKRRAHGNSTVITILTTNYDILFELAASKVGTGIRVETGFDGPLSRVFNPEVFNFTRGTPDGTKFNPVNELQINIIKLHGSIVWQKDGETIIENGLGNQNPASGKSERLMVLPQRSKVTEMQAEPFNQLFIRASRILGKKCKYLVSCGYSFGDDHINQQLIFPKLSEGNIRLTAMCGNEPECLDKLKTYPSFHAVLPNDCFFDGKSTGSGTNHWKFNSLVKLIES